MVVAVAPKLTAVAPVKFVPVILRISPPPEGPPASDKAVIVGGGGKTLMAVRAPDVELLTVSVAVTEAAAFTVFNVVEKLPVPLVNVALLGRMAKPSLLVKCTVPE